MKKVVSPRGLFWVEIVAVMQNSFLNSFFFQDTLSGSNILDSDQVIGFDLVLNYLQRLSAVIIQQ